jgi:hypothetical protein
MQESYHISYGDNTHLALGTYKAFCQNEHLTPNLLIWPQYLPPSPVAVRFHMMTVNLRKARKPLALWTA